MSINDTQGQAGEPKSQAQGEGNLDSQEEKFVTKDFFAQETNKIITSHLKRFEKNVEKMLSSRSQKETDPSEEQGEKVDPQLSRTKELEKTVKALLEKDKAREAELERQKINTSLTDELLKNGINGSFAKHAVGFLVNTEQAIHKNEDGEVVVRINNVDYDLPTGIAMWSKSEDAQVYMAPKNIKGAGNKKVSSTPSNSDKQPSREEIGESLLELYKSQF